MSASNADAGTDATQAAPPRVPAKKKPVKKTAKKKPAKKKATKKKVVKKTAKKKATKSEGLRKPQVRILQCLGKSRKSLTRSEISEKAPVDLAMLNSYIGSHDDAIRAKNDKEIMPSLRTLGFVRVSQQDVDGRDKVVHEITSAGKKALEKLSSK